MKLDDEVCCCFHVPKRKLVNFTRRRKPKVASQLSECHGAGTGCGWCIPYLEALFEVMHGRETEIDPEAILADADPETYARARLAYLKSKKDE